MDEYGNGLIHYATHIALEENNIEMLEMLLANGENPNLKTKTGYTCIEYAILKSNTDVLELLSKYGSIVKKI